MDMVSNPKFENEDLYPERDVVFEEYQTLRKPDGDGVQDLSLHNYHVMRDFVGDPNILKVPLITSLFHDFYSVSIKLN